METCDHPVLFWGHGTKPDGPETAHQALGATTENVLDNSPRLNTEVARVFPAEKLYILHFFHLILGSGE